MTSHAAACRHEQGVPAPISSSDGVRRDSRKQDRTSAHVDDSYCLLRSSICGTLFCHAHLIFINLMAYAIASCARQYHSAQLGPLSHLAARASMSPSYTLHPGFSASPSLLRRWSRFASRRAATTGCRPTCRAAGGWAGGLAGGLAGLREGATDLRQRSPFEAKQPPNACMAGGARYVPVAGWLAGFAGEGR